MFFKLKVGCDVIKGNDSVTEGKKQDDSCYICFLPKKKTYSSKEFYKCKMEHNGCLICKSCTQNWKKKCESNGTITRCPLCSAESYVSQKSFIQIMVACVEDM